MEFEYASTGHTSALRTWLQHYPHRVNIPAVSSNYTLLHTAVQQRHVHTARMLLSEFDADPTVPCGALGDTAIHAAARNGDAVLLAELLARHPPLRANLLLQTPTIVAHGACRDMLRNYEQQAQQRLQLELQQQQRNEWSGGRGEEQWASGAPIRVPPPPPPPSTQAPHILAEALRETIRDLRISNDDDDDNGGVMTQYFSSASPVPMMGGSATQMPGVAVQRTSLLSPSAGANGMGSNYSRANGTVVNHTSAPPRNTHNLASDSVLPLDLHAFRRVYGSAFDFAENSYAYQVRGVLPYTFRDVVYYTPVILIAKKRLSSSSSSSGTNGGRKTLPYRAIIDRNRLGSLLISRRATYIDSSSGVIIPNALDAYYCTLVEFVQDALIANFERIPPLTSSINGRTGIRLDAPLFSLCPDERMITLRILRDLSRFCDDAFQYNRSTGKVTGALPLFIAIRRTGTPLSEARTNPQPSPRLRDEVSWPNSSNGVGVNNGVLVAELLLRLPLSLLFSQQRNFDEPPRVYLTNAIAGNPETQENYNFLASIIINSSTGEVHRGALTSLSNWKEHGSLVNILLELQRMAVALLIKYCKTTTIVPNTLLEASQGVKNLGTTVSSVMTASGCGLHTGKKEAAGSISNDSDYDGDWLLIPAPSRGETPRSTTTTQTPMRTTTTPTQSSYSSSASYSKCVACMEAEKNFLLLPCRHLALCRACSKRYLDRLADEMMCPICRTTIKGVLEVYI